MENGKKRYGFEAASRRTILSEEKELASLPGFRIRARKYTINAADEIAAAQERKRLALPVRLRGVALLAERSGRQIEDLLAEMPQAEVEELVGELQPGAISMAEIMRVSILHGLGEHNLDDGETRSSEVGPELVARIMEYAEIATEVFGIIQDWNSPLPKAMPAPLRTSPNGSTTAAPSNPERNTPTEANQPS